MKRSSQNLDLNKTGRLSRLYKRPIASTFKLGEPIKPSENLLNKYPFTTSINVASFLIEETINRVNKTISNLEIRKYYDQVINFVRSLSKVVEFSVHPLIDDVQQTHQSQQEPLTIQADQICIKQTAIERRKIMHNRASSTLVILNKNSLHSKSSYLPSNPLKNIRYSIGLVPLELQQNETNTDIKTNQLRTLYRDKTSNEISQCGPGQSVAPSLLMARKIKKEKQHQYNYDYNGDKIPIGLGLIQKKPEINVLKMLCRIPKDKQQDIKNPKKSIETFKHSRLPSVHSKFNLNSGKQLYDFKKTIQKSIQQKYCKLSSIRASQEDK